MFTRCGLCADRGTPFPTGRLRRAAVDAIPFPTPVMLLGHDAGHTGQHVIHRRISTRAQLLSTSTAVALQPGLQQSPQAEAAELLGRRRPKDIFEGLANGLKLAVVGTSVGAFMAFYAVISAVRGRRRRRGGATIALKFMGNLLAGAVFALGCLLMAAFEVARGMANTPEAICARRQHQVWDGSVGQWFDVNLAALKHRLEREDDVTGKVASNVIDTGFYDLLNVSPAASAKDIKAAYYREARLCHPDTNQNDEGAREKFQRLAEAYQILADPEMRKKYDGGGKDAVQGKGPLGRVDPAVFFSILFGAEVFEPWVGELKLAMQADQFGKLASAGPPKQGRGNHDDVFSSFQHRVLDVGPVQRRQLRREVLCACHLQHVLDVWAAGSSEEHEVWDQELRQQAVKLSGGQRGPEMLTTLGEAYQLCSELCLAERLRGRLSKEWLRASAKRGGRVLRQARRTVGMLIASLRTTMKGWRAVASRGVATADEQRREAQAAFEEALPQLLQMLWCTVLADVSHTVVRSGDMVLWEKAVPLEVRTRRALALGRLGRIFCEEGSAKLAAAGAGAGTPGAGAVDPPSPADVRAVLQQALAASAQGRPRPL